MSQDENGARETSSQTTECHVSSANLFDKGNTPFRRGLGAKNSASDTNGSPTKTTAKNHNNSNQLRKNTDSAGIDLDVSGADSTALIGGPSDGFRSDQAAESTLDVAEISREIPSFSASLATFEKEWNSIIDKYSNVEDQGDVVDLASGTIVTNNGHLELLEDEEDTIWDSMFPEHKEAGGDDGNGAAVSAPPTPSLLQQLGEFQSESEEEEVIEREKGKERDDKSAKRRRVSLWDV